MSNKSVKVFNMGLLVQATIRNMVEDHNQALNLDYDRYTWAYTQDDHVLVVDDRGQRYDLNGQTGEVYSACFVMGKWVLNETPLGQGEYSWRDQDYGFMTLYINLMGQEYKQTVGQHRMIALCFDRAGFIRALKSGINPGAVVVNHKDNCGFHNCPSNLEWCSQKYNCIHYTYVNTQVLLDPASATDVDQRYLREGVSVYDLMFALCLYRAVGMDGAAMINAIQNMDSYDVHKLLADPWTMPEVKRACNWFLNRPGCVSSDDITVDFIKYFNKVKNIDIIF